MNLNADHITFLTAMFILFSKDLKQIRMVAFMGAALQLVLGDFYYMFIVTRELPVIPVNFYLNRVLPGIRP